MFWRGLILEAAGRWLLPEVGGVAWSGTARHVYGSEIFEKPSDLRAPWSSCRNRQWQRPAELRKPRFFVP